MSIPTLLRINGADPSNRLKNHFTSLISSISFTLYALLPTLQPQVFEAYPVEKTSRAIQGSASTSASSTMAGSTSSIEISEPLNSLHLYGQGSQELEPPKEVVDNQSPQFSPSVPLVPAVDESWASEFQKKDSAGAEAETESGIMIGGSVEIPETDDGVSYQCVVQKEGLLIFKFHSVIFHCLTVYLITSYRHNFRLPFPIF